MKLFFKAKTSGKFYGDILSLGIVSEDGKQFYAEFNDYDKRQVNLTTKLCVLDKFVKKDEFVEGYHIGNTYDNGLALETWLNQFKDEEELILVSDNDPFGFAHFRFIDELVYCRKCCHYGCFATKYETMLSRVAKGYYDICYDFSKFFEIPFEESLLIDKAEFITKAKLYSMRPEDDMVIPAPKGTAIYDAHIVRKIYETMNATNEEPPVEEGGEDNVPE